MTIHFHCTGGFIKGGRMIGSGEVFIEDPDTGDGSILMGNFNSHGKLNDPDGICVVYTETAYTKYIGPIINGIMDGTFDILEYEEKGNPQSGNENGNGVGGNCGKKWIANSAAQNRLNGTKRSVIFDNDAEISELSSSQQFMLITIGQKKFNNRNLFNRFDVTEDT